MKIAIRNQCSDFTSYRAARVKSLFNAESGCNFNRDFELPIEDDGWRLGLVVGPSGSGKTSVGKQLFGPEAMVNLGSGWPEDKPIVDAIAAEGDFNDVTGGLAAVGLGDVPTWLRPFQVLSNGEQFRAGLARLICEAPKTAVVDEFTSVVDRQIAKFGALAFQKAWRRTGGKAVLLSCHYDVIDWLEPDWILDTATGLYSGRCLWRRPKFELEIWETDSRYWKAFEPHHYLKLPKMIAASYYVGTVDGELVAHVATSPRLDIGAMRACRLVVMPEWQGAGVGMRFLNVVCQMQLDGGNKWGRKVRTVYFHTSHPGLCAALRRDKKWRQRSAILYGGSKITSASRVRGARAKDKKMSVQGATGYGGHFRSIQGFAFVGEPKA